MTSILRVLFPQSPRLSMWNVLLMALSLYVTGVAMAQDVHMAGERPGVSEIADGDPVRILEHAMRCKEMGLYIEESEALEKLKRMPERLNLRQRVQCLYELSYSYYAMGTYQLSLKNLFDLLRMEKPDSLRYFDISARTVLAGTYMRFHAVAQADSVLDAVEHSLDRYSFPERIERNLRQSYYPERSTVCAERGDWPCYFDMLRMSDRYSEPDDEQKLRRTLDYGIYYMQTGDPGMAEQYFKRLQARPDWSYDKMAGMTNYAEMLLNIGRDEDCERVATETLSLLDGRRMDQMKSSLLLYKGLALSRLGRTAEAVPLLEESRHIRDSIFEWHTSHSVLGSAKEFERDLDRETVRNVERSNRQGRVIIWCLAALVTILLGMIGWVVWKASRLSEKEKMLQQQLDSIESRHAENISETRTELSDNNRRMVALTLKLAQVNDLVRKAIDTDQTLDDAGRVAQLREGMKSVDLNRNVWETFDILFEQTRPNFYSDLRRLHPDLTKGELRMSAYIMMNLSTKEISAITNRSTRTVETVKYRLRKKMGLPEGTTLTDYLHQVSDYRQ